jgi:hypothetical protein
MLNLSAYPPTTLRAGVENLEGSAHPSKKVYSRLSSARSCGTGACAKASTIADMGFPIVIAKFCTGDNFLIVE